MASAEAFETVQVGVLMEAFAAAERSGTAIVACDANIHGPMPRTERWVRARGVLDALWWTLAAAPDLSTSRFALLVPTSREAESGFPVDWVAGLVKRLEESTKVVTHLWDDLPSPSGKQRPRLLGPTLDRIGPFATVIALASGPILDRDDFADAEWLDRLLIIEPGESFESVVVSARNLVARGLR